MNKIIEESLDAVKKLKASAKNAAFESLKNDLLKEEVANELNEGKNDGVSTGNDQPSGFDKEGAGQKRIQGVGDSLESEGDGPAIIEGDEPDSDAEMKLEDDEEEKKEKEDMDEAEDEKKKDKEPDDDEDDLDLDLNAVVAEMEDGEKEAEKKEKEAKNEAEDEKEKKDKEEDELKKENIQLRKENAKLKVENANYSKALKLTTAKMNEATLVNQKMAYISDIFGKYPSLKVENKKKIMNKFDNAKTLKEAKNVYQIYTEALKDFKSTSKSTKLTEAKKIVEAANKNTNKNTELINENYNHFAKLAGIE